MRSSIVVAAAAVAALALAPPGPAKGIERATVCGASGCRALEDPSQALVGFGDGRPDRPAAPAPYYRVEFQVSVHEETAWTVWYVPRSRVGATVATGRAEFERLEGASRAAFERATRGIEPFPAPRVTGARVGGRPVPRPASYVSLLGRPGTLGPPVAGDWITIEVRTNVESPWTGGPALLLSPSTRILQDGFRFSRLDPGTVERILARRPLGRDARSPGLAAGARVPAPAGAAAASRSASQVVAPVRRERPGDG